MAEGVLGGTEKAIIKGLQRLKCLVYTLSNEAEAGGGGKEVVNSYIKWGIIIICLSNKRIFLGNTNKINL